MQYELVLPPYCRIQSENTGLSTDRSEPFDGSMIQEPEDVNEHFVRNLGYRYRFRFFLALECEGLREGLDDMGYSALGDGGMVGRIL